MRVKFYMAKKLVLKLVLGMESSVPILCQHFKKVLATDIDNRFFKYFYSKNLLRIYL